MDLIRVGDLIQEMVIRADAAERRRGNFYRPAHRTQPGKPKVSKVRKLAKWKAMQGIQLDLFPAKAAE